MNERFTIPSPLCNAYKRGFIYQRQKSNYTKDRIKAYLLEKYKDYEFLPDYEIGDYTYGLPEIFWYGEKAKLRIGKFCSIAKGVTIFLGGEHEIQRVTSYPFAYYSFEWEAVQKIESIEVRPSKGDVEIGNDVWIGHNATILSGVTIGDGAVVGANALVTKNIPPYAVYGGNPAVYIKNRFAENYIKALLRIKWWDWPKEKIDQAIPTLISGSLEDFINIYN